MTTLLEYPNYRDNPSVVEALGSSHHEISRSDIIDEALEGVFGGTEAIGHASTNIAFHLAKDQHIRANLRQELNAGAFHPGMAPNAVISKFPYLVMQYLGLRNLTNNVRWLSSKRDSEPSVATIIDSQEYAHTISSIGDIFYPQASVSISPD